MAILVLLGSGAESMADGYRKTIVVVTDSLDFEDIEKLGRDSSVGLLSLKSGESYGGSPESHMMTIATGRRVKIEAGSFEGIESSGEKLVVKNYEAILSQLDLGYKDFSTRMEFLGEGLRKLGRKTSYIGDSEDILLIADKSGEVDFGYTDMDYDRESLSEKIDEMIGKSDLLLLSYEMEGDPKRLDTLLEILGQREENIMMFPKTVSGDIDHKFNSTIVPIVYRVEGEDGILTSDSTKRTGVVSNTDIMVDILERSGVEQEFAIGNRLEVEQYDGDKVEAVREIMTGFLNLDIVKYLFRAVVIAAQLVAIALLLRGKKISPSIIFMPIVLIAVTLMFGTTSLSRHLFPYIAVTFGISVAASIYLGRKAASSKTIDAIAIFTNVFIFAFMFLDFEVLYNSFVGYNSIVAALRFYGYNNDIMGVFLGTGMTVYFLASSRVEKKYRIILTLYTAALVVSHTEGYGSNFGGLMTSTFMAGALIYYEYFYGKNRKWQFLGLATGLLVVVGAIIYAGGEGSHIGEFFIRVREYGYIEFWNMIYRKAKQVVLVMLIPPVGIVVFAQSLIFFRYVREHVEKGSREYVRHMICYATAVFAMVLNDTGALAFLYIMVYSLSKIMMELKDKNEVKKGGM